MTVREMDKTLKHNIHCDRCGMPIIIGHTTFRKYKNQPHYCRSCRGYFNQERIKSLSEEERLEYLKNKNTAISNGWNKQSKEIKKKIHDDRVVAWAMNQERKSNHEKMLSNRWNNMSQEEKDKQIKLMNDGKIEYWSNPDIREYHAKRAREKWYNQSVEEQERILQLLKNGRDTFIANLTEEDKLERSKKQSSRSKEYWANLSPEEYQSQILKFRNGLKKSFDNLNIIPNKNEFALIDYFHKHLIPYEFIWYNEIKHEQFDELFPSNPSRPGSDVSPFHAWDFNLKLHDMNILVDIDGSIHDPSCTGNYVTDNIGNKYILSDYIQFKDAQRPYQTDGMDAYIIICYDDKLTDNTPVVNLYTNERMTMQSFISLLVFMNMSDKEKNDLIKLM